jgi:LemA protein
MVLSATGVLLVLWAIGAYNRLVGLRSAVAQAWTPLGSHLARRHALALEICTLLGGPEAEAAMGDDIGRAALQTLQAATRQAAAAAAHTRVRTAAAGPVLSLALAEQVLNGALRPFPVLMSARFEALEGAGVIVQARALLLALHELHAQLRFTRLAFNAAVGAYNAAIDELPTRLLAGPLGFRPSAALLAQDQDLRPPDAVGTA